MSICQLFCFVVCAQKIRGNVLEFFRDIKSFIVQDRVNIIRFFFSAYNCRHGDPSRSLGCVCFIDTLKRGNLLAIRSDALS